MARLTLYGMYQYDNTILDGIRLPVNKDTGDPFMNLSDFTGTLMSYCGDLYPYYQVPPKLKELVGIWGRERQGEWQRMYDALYAKYDPIENYNRFDDSDNHDIHSGTDQSRDSGTDTSQDSGTDISQDSGTDTKTDADSRRIETSHSGTDTATNMVSAFDTEGFSNRTQDTDDYGHVITDQHSGNETITDQYGKKNEFTHGRKNDTTYGKTNDFTHGHKIDTKYHLHAHGNIGVTTTQQMITQEMKLRMDYDIVSVIMREFEDQFISQYYG